LRLGCWPRGRPRSRRAGYADRWAPVRTTISRWRSRKPSAHNPGEFLDAYAGKMGKVRFYKLTPAKVWFTDNERHFGKRDVLDCATGEVVVAKA
jgi:hypothetical protein